MIDTTMAPDLETGPITSAGENQREAPAQREGMVARTIERQTARLPSDLFLWAAGASICASLMLKTQGHKSTSLFVGQWAPTFLILGLYNKLVKVAGHDRAS